MYDKKTATITFPHLIPSPVLDGKRYSLNDAQGGSKKIADLGLEVNSFYGGNCHAVFMIPDLGFYLCPRRDTNEALGFYVHDWTTVTEKGKEVLQRRFPDCTIVFDNVAPAVLTKEQREEKQRLAAEALAHGADPTLVTHANSEELASLIKAIDSGMSSTPIATMASSEAIYAEEPVDQVDQNGVKRGRRGTRSF